MPATITNTDQAMATRGRYTQEHTQRPKDKMKKTIKVKERSTLFLSEMITKLEMNNNKRNATLEQKTAADTRQ